MWSLLRRDAMTVWQQVELKSRLVKYREIFQNKRLPRYKLARLFHVPFNEKMKKDELMEIHEHYQPKFKEWLEEKQQYSIEDIEKEVFSKYKEEEIEKNNYLKLKVKILNDVLSACEFCENRCKANRVEGKIGNCGVDGKAYVSSAFIHMGEEAPIIPSGTIFFYGCTLNDDDKLPFQSYHFRFGHKHFQCCSVICFVQFRKFTSDGNTTISKNRIN